MWYWIILGLILLINVWNLFILFRKYKARNNIIPDSVKDIYDKDEYTKWKEYSGAKVKLDIIATFVSLAVMVTLYATRVFGLVNNQLINSGYLADFLILLISIVASSLAALPFNYISTMKIEAKYGFNKTTKQTFIGDQIKGVIIGLFLTVIPALIFRALYQSMGRWSYLVMFAIVLGIMLFLMAFIRKLMTISNKFTPLEDGSLKDKLTNLLNSNGYSIKKIEVMDGSKRSTKANAMFAGLGKFKTIVLYDTLLEQLTEDEIVAVFAHELGHGKHGDVFSGFLRSIFTVALLCACCILVMEVPQISVDSGFLSFNFGFVVMLGMDVFFSFTSPFVNLFSSYFSKKQEYAADSFAKDQGYKNELISALKKLTKNSLSDISPDPLEVKLSYSHPTLAQRIDNITK